MMHLILRGCPGDSIDFFKQRALLPAGLFVFGEIIGLIFLFLQIKK